MVHSPMLAAASASGDRSYFLPHSDGGGLQTPSRGSLCSTGRWSVSRGPAPPASLAVLGPDWGLSKPGSTSDRGRFLPVAALNHASLAVTLTSVVGPQQRRAESYESNSRVPHEARTLQHPDNLDTYIS